MKTTTAYEASDGSLWKTEEECKLQEDKLKAEESFQNLYNRFSNYGEIKIKSTQEFREMVQSYPDLFQYWIDTK